MAQENPVTKDIICADNLKLTESQMISAEKLYLLGAKDDKFRAIGPFHKVEPKYLNYLVDRLATPVIRPCSRGHSKGAWASEDKFYKDFEHPKTSYEQFKERREANSGRSSAHSGYSLPGYAMPQNRNQRSAMSSCDSPGRHSAPYTEDSMRRYSRATIASRGGVDIREKFESKDYVYGSAKVPDEKLDDIVDRISRPTHSSMGNHQRKYTDYVIGDKVVDSEEFEEIRDRLVKPTVASQGGGPLLDKKFVYKIPATTKTNPRIPHIKEKRQKRMKKTVTKEELQQIVERLNKLTPAYKAKYSMCPHVWNDPSKVGPAFQNQLTIA